jgi:hypothetical protein
MMLAYQKSRILFLLFCLAFFISCHKQAATSQNGTSNSEKTTSKEIPAWLQTKISEFQKDKPANPPIKIYSYLYHSQQVYYIPSRCCDIPGAVYTLQGQQLCQPDGGITGRGDGKCADFFEARTNEKLIWEDLRK